MFHQESVQRTVANRMFTLRLQYFRAYSCQRKRIRTFKMSDSTYFVYLYLTNKYNGIPKSTWAQDQRQKPDLFCQSFCYCNVPTYALRIAL